MLSLYRAAGRVLVEHSTVKAQCFLPYTLQHLPCTTSNWIQNSPNYGFESQQPTKRGVNEYSAHYRMPGEWVCRETWHHPRKIPPNPNSSPLQFRHPRDFPGAGAMRFLRFVSQAFVAPWPPPAPTPPSWYLFF